MTAIAADAVARITAITAMLGPDPLTTARQNAAWTRDVKHGCACPHRMDRRRVDPQRRSNMPHPHHRTATRRRSHRMNCAIHWRSFGLEDPGPIGCVGKPIFTVACACVHEHIATADLCYACLAELLSYGDPADWTCGPCLAAGCDCPSPLTILDLVTP